MKRFCYRCGAPEVERGSLIQGLCQRCFAQENSLLRAPAELEVTICKQCGAHLVGKRWQEAGKGDAIVDAARAVTSSSLRIAHLTPTGMKFLHPHETPEVELFIEPKPNERVIEVKARGKIHELQTQPQLEEACIKLFLNRVTCEVCSLKSAHHYEAVLQVRGKLTKEKRSEVRRMLEQLAADAGEHKRMAFISLIEERREGLDIYVNPASLARRMAALLKSNFGVKLKESAKLVGETPDGRRKFRITILAWIEKCKN